VTLRWRVSVAWTIALLVPAVALLQAAAWASANDMPLRYVFYQPLWYRVWKHEPVTVPIPLAHAP